MCTSGDINLPPPTPTPPTERVATSCLNNRNTSVNAAGFTAQQQQHAAVQIPRKSFGKIRQAVFFHYIKGLEFTLGDSWILLKS